LIQLVFLSIVIGFSSIGFSQVEDGSYFDEQGEEYEIIVNGGSEGEIAFDVKSIEESIFNISNGAIEDLKSILAPDVEDFSQVVIVTGKRLDNSDEVLSAQDYIDAMNNAALWEAMQLAEKSINDVKNAPRNSNRNTAVTKATDKQTKLKENIKRDKALMESINKDPNRCSPANQAILQRINSYHSQTQIHGLDPISPCNYSIDLSQVDPIFSTPPSDFCAAAAFADRASRGYYGDSITLSLDAGLDALKAEMDNLAGLAKGTLEWCDN
jgi:hypothetical protein